MWFLHLTVSCITDTGTNYLTGAAALVSFQLFHLTVLTVVQIRYQASGIADWIYQAEQLQKL
jgi:hypothetical protein